MRETGVPAPPDGVLRVPVAGGAALLTAPVRYWSATGWHRFGPACLSAPPGGPGTPAAGRVPPVERPLDAVTAAVLLAGEATRRPHPRDLADLVGRVADSVRRTSLIIADRRGHPEAPPGTTPFLEAEQGLLLGHPFHPTPKSREGLGDEEELAYSPEHRGSFPLHWFAVDRDLLASDSALPVPAHRITEGLLGGAARLPPGTAALPLHPWQARNVALRPGVRDLLECGRIVDLGPRGEPWCPTSSLRTVHRPGGRFMLKLSLGLRITNSRREHLRKELHRGVEVHRLLAAGLAAEWHAHHPRFDILRDPAWLSVDLPGLPPGSSGGLDVVVRQQPFRPGERAVCLAGLVAEQPLPDTASGSGVRSHLADLVRNLARRTGRAVPAVAAEWLLRHLRAVVAPVLWLDGRAGVALEAHQQNSLVLLDADGWPVGGRYRDNQGYYLRTSRADDILARLPGAGTAGDSFVEDHVADERLAYYLGINHILGLVGAMGSQGLADERVLLACLRTFLSGAAAASASGLPARLLDSPTLRCKANLLTRLYGMDELSGPVETQSVYVRMPNPLRAAASAGSGR